MRSAFVLLALVLASCGQSDTPGLLVDVDTTAYPCYWLTDSGVTVTIGAGNLYSDDAVDFEHSGRHWRWLFAWPAGVADGAAGTVEFYGTGDAATTGHAVASFTAHPPGQQTVKLIPTCTWGLDAGLPDAATPDGT